ncbi:MAG: hypothetical protein MHM6MM_005929 [Cercozoa sp. M6MM]
MPAESDDTRPRPQSAPARSVKPRRLFKRRRVLRPQRQTDTDSADTENNDTLSVHSENNGTQTAPRVVETQQEDDSHWLGLLKEEPITPTTPIGLRRFKSRRRAFMRACTPEREKRMIAFSSPHSRGSLRDTRADDSDESGGLLRRSFSGGSLPYLTGDLRADLEHVRTASGHEAARAIAHLVSTIRAQPDEASSRGYVSLFVHTLLRFFSSPSPLAETEDGSAELAAHEALISLLQLRGVSASRYVTLRHVHVALSHVLTPRNSQSGRSDRKDRTETAQTDQSDAAVHGKSRMRSRRRRGGRNSNVASQSQPEDESEVCDISRPLIETGKVSSSGSVASLCATWLLLLAGCSCDNGSRHVDKVDTSAGNPLTQLDLPTYRRVALGVATVTRVQPTKDSVTRLRALVAVLMCARGRTQTQTVLLALTNRVTDTVDRTSDSDSDSDTTDGDSDGENAKASADCEYVLRSTVPWATSLLLDAISSTLHSCMSTPVS